MFTSVLLSDVSVMVELTNVLWFRNMEISVQRRWRVHERETNYM